MNARRRAARGIPGRRTGRRVVVGPRKRPWSTATGLLLLAAMLATATLPWWPVYESPGFVVAVAVAAVAGLAIGFAGAWGRWPAWQVIVAMGIAYLVLGVPAAVPGQAIGGVIPTPSGLADLVTATWLSWKQLVTVAIPVGSYQALLVPPFLLVLVAATGAASLALRSRIPATAILPPAGVLMAGIALGAVTGAPSMLAGLAFLVLAIAWLVRSAIQRRRAIGAGGRSGASLIEVRRIVGASVIAAVAAGLAATAASALPLAPRAVVRAELQPAFDPLTRLSPLADFRTAFAPNAADRVMLDVTGLPAGWGLRLAALDTYDGVVYSVGGAGSVSGRFARVPYRLDQSAAPGESLRLSVSVAGYRDVWVPGAGRLERITFGGRNADELAAAFAYNDVTGTGAVRDGLSDGDRFEAVSVATAPLASASGFQPGTSVLPAIPVLPDPLQRKLDEWAPSTLTDGERLTAVLTGIRRDGYISHGGPDEPASRPGHSLDRLVELVDERPMVGDGEQYAVLAALLARQIGFPARVVVGYLAPVPDGPGADGLGDPALAIGATEVRSADLRAWIEVQTADGGWRQLDPNPDARDVPERIPDESTPVSRPQSALPPPERRTPVEELQVDPEQAGDAGEQSVDPWLAALGRAAGAIGVVVLATALVATPFAAVVLAKVRRRRIRRSAPDPLDRAEGAWAEFADTAVDHGYQVPPAGTRAEQAAAVGGLLPLALAASVDRAMYAPDSSGRGPAADEVWSTVDRLRIDLDRDRTRLDRLRALVSLRSLGGYAGSRRGGRT